MSRRYFAQALFKYASKSQPFVRQRTVNHRYDLADYPRIRWITLWMERLLQKSSAELC